MHRDIAVTGKGVLDGGADADHWWNWHHQVETSWSENKLDLQLADRRTLRSMNLGGVPVDRRIFGEGHYLRPNFFQPIRCQRVLLQGVTLRNSPMWQLNPVLLQQRGGGRGDPFQSRCQQRRLRPGELQRRVDQKLPL